MKPPPDRPDTVVWLVSTLSAGNGTAACADGAAASTETAMARPRIADGIFFMACLLIFSMCSDGFEAGCRCAVRACGGERRRVSDAVVSISRKYRGTGFA